QRPRARYARERNQGDLRAQSPTPLHAFLQMLCAPQGLQGRLLGFPRGSDGGTLADVGLAQIQARGRVMRLLAAMAGAKHGGAEAFFERLLLAFRRAGVEICAAIREGPARAARLRGAGIEVRGVK